MREETGLRAASWESLGPIHSLDGVADAPGHVFLARDLSPATYDDDGGMAEEGCSPSRGPR
ncbi:hypothetical protein [Nocardioides sp. Kera G14]|uniref:hypothetical protein n=1 Tax=Nocardioides sp. Kera G14 TaxID=2884264 RepID=UPI001D102EF9|nr:hypothetical protein [Nocardioides sp. Kera G14]UDY25404.1 hypothetical protein LH076_11510 [Nocardioides sp. Kera G14]